MEAMIYGIMYYSNKFSKTATINDRALGGTWYNDYQAEKKKLSKRINPNNYAKIMGSMGVTSEKSIYKNKKH
jgi:hypothetical protein